MEHEWDDESRIAGIAAVQFAMGHKKEADAALSQLSKQAADDWASGIASVQDLYLIKGNPLYRNVVRDPRYTAFLRKMNLPE
jgi:hypothetical protein